MADNSGTAIVERQASNFNEADATWTFQGLRAMVREQRVTRGYYTPDDLFICTPMICHDAHVYHTEPIMIEAFRCMFAQHELWFDPEATPIQIRDASTFPRMCVVCGEDSSQSNFCFDP